MYRQQWITNMPEMYLYLVFVSSMKTVRICNLFTHCYLCYNKHMKSQKGNVGLYLIIFVSIAIVAGAVWFVMGKNRIITAVPESGSDGQRVILVTPQATPTSKFDEATDSPTPAPTSSDEETPTPTEPE